jgi:hypothetical protein
LMSQVFFKKLKKINLQGNIKKKLETAAPTGPVASFVHYYSGAYQLRNVESLEIPFQLSLTIELVIEKHNKST